MELTSLGHAVVSDGIQRTVPSGKSWQVLSALWTEPCGHSSAKVFPCETIGQWKVPWGPFSSTSSGHWSVASTSRSHEQHYTHQLSVGILYLRVGIVCLENRLSKCTQNHQQGQYKFRRFGTDPGRSRLSKFHHSMSQLNMLPIFHLFNFLFFSWLIPISSSQLRPSNPGMQKQV